ncbi:MAG TPA: transglycosylase domain-containing protein, partial [Candidatus Peribacteria bacterium]|nr:transglycosylase domain-containing protein [Candidatus Peribacteria bacterium]
MRILDRRDGDLYRFYDEEDRFYLPGDKIPALVKNAFVAIEDERFYSRKVCIDFRAIARALEVNLFEDRTEGASTITQQLVRNLYLTREKTIDRKLKEIDLACQLEQSLSKEEILTIYLNQLAFGNNAFGIEQAAQTYFGKSATEVSLAQAAVLASIPQRNSYFNPYGTHARTAVAHDVVKQLREGTLRPEDLSAEDIRVGLLSRVQQTPKGLIRIPGRAETVLDAMKRNGLILQSEYDAAVKELPKLSFKAVKHPISAPHFTLRVREEIDSLLSNGLDRPDRWLTEGMEVHTTLDPVLQWIAEDVTDRALPRLNGVGIHNVALVAIDRKTRQVLAYVGNADYFGDGGTGQIDMAATPRQPGSSFKPIVYSALFEDGYGPDSFIEDAP